MTEEQRTLQESIDDGMLPYICTYCNRLYLMRTVMLGGQSMFYMENLRSYDLPKEEKLALILKTDSKASVLRADSMCHECAGAERKYWSK